MLELSNFKKEQDSIESQINSEILNEIRASTSEYCRVLAKQENVIKVGIIGYPEIFVLKVTNQEGWIAFYNYSMVGRFTNLKDSLFYVDTLHKANN